MKDTVMLSVAASLECDPALLPYLPELLQDLDSLGSETETVVRLLSQHGMDESDRVLDLCCGKGAAAIAVARAFGCAVHGIDAMPAFIDSANKASQRAGVSDRCRFEVADISESLDSLHGFDGVLFSAVGPILGGIAATTRRLLGPLRPGGWLLMEDSVLRPGAPGRQGYRFHAGFDQTRAQIRSAGAQIVVIERQDTRFTANHAEDHSRLESRARALLQREPQLEETVHAYLEGQREEVRFLEDWTDDVTWLLRKPG